MRVCGKRQQKYYMQCIKHTSCATQYIITILETIDGSLHTLLMHPYSSRPLVAFLFVSVLLFPFLAYAGDEMEPVAWFEPRPGIGKRATWTPGQDIVIVGANLKGRYSVQDGYPSDREVCLVSEANANDVQCMNPKDSLIKEWSQHLLIVAIPEDIVPRGTVKLRFYTKKQECKNITGTDTIGMSCGKVLKWGDDVLIGSYELVPSVTTIIDRETGGDFKGNLLPGKEYEVRGHWFGGGRGKVRVNGRQLFASEIIVWLPDAVAIRPSFWGKFVEVHNGVGWSVPVPAYVEKPLWQRIRLHTQVKRSGSRRLRRAYDASLLRVAPLLGPRSGRE